MARELMWVGDYNGAINILEKVLDQRFPEDRVKVVSQSLHKTWEECRRLTGEEFLAKIKLFKESFGISGMELLKIMLLNEVFKLKEELLRIIEIEVEVANVVRKTKVIFSVIDRGNKTFELRALFKSRVSLENIRDKLEKFLRGNVVVEFLIKKDPSFMLEYFRRAYIFRFVFLVGDFNVLAYLRTC